MTRMSFALTVVLLLVASAAPAHAGPVFAAIGAVISAIKGSIFLSALARIAASVVLSRLAAALAPKPRQPGIKTDGTSSGSQNPASFILGLYATDGVAVCPPMSHGNVGKTPNAYLNYVIELSDLPGCALQALIINGERCTLGGVAHPDYGLPVTGGTYGGNAWVRYYDGTQTVADPMLRAKYGAYPNRPWTAAMVGRGICYAVLTFRYNREIFTSFPTVRFEMLGIRVYDPRKDSTVGGSGAHRLANPATWERTHNPIIMAYNAHLGFQMLNGEVWGGGMPQSDIPLASVFAAANACDALVDNGAGGTEARFRAGYEVFVSDEPAGVAEEFLKACIGAVADVGGEWRFQAGDPSLPVFFLTDDDFLISLDRERQPFPPISETNNGITASYPDPAVQWEPNEAPPLLNAGWEAQDGGRRRVVNVDFPAVPYAAQVQRNMRAMIADDRRFLTHGLPLPPEATVLEPLDTASWNSATYGYSSKTFEVVTTTENLRTGVVQVSLRERDPSDTAIPPGYFSPVGAPSAVPVINAPQVVPSFAASGTSIVDGGGNARRPAVLLTWDGTDLDGIRGVEYEVRRTGAIALVAKGSTTDVASGQMIVPEGILPSTSYEARALLVSDRATAWTAWLPVTTPATLITSPDLAVGSVSDQRQVFVLGPLSKVALPTGTVVATLSIGAIGNGEGWERRFHFEARRVSSSAGFWELVLERRLAQLGNPFGAWVVLETFQVSNDLDWQVFGDAGNLSEPMDDFQYRLRVSDGFTAGIADVLRNVFLTAVRITK